MANQQSAPNICPFCGYGNRLGVIFCEECGNPLDSNMPKAGSTRGVPQPSPNDPGLDEIQKILQQSPQEPAPEKSGPSLFNRLINEAESQSEVAAPAPVGGGHQPFVLLPTNQFALQIEGASRPMILGPVGQKDLVVGRNDPEDQFKPDIDLVPFGAMEHGISRRHASLIASGNRLQLMDLQSSNGTFLNGYRLEPREPHQLRDGDQLRFGNLRMTVKFLE